MSGRAMTAQGYFAGGCFSLPGAWQTHMGLSLLVALGAEITHSSYQSKMLPIGEMGLQTAIFPKTDS